MYHQKPWLSHYEAAVPATVTVDDTLLHTMLVDSARRFPGHVAVRMILKYLPLGLVIQSKMTYRELDEATDRFAAALWDLGLRQGDRVAIMLPNLPQQVIAFFGTLKAGCIVVNTNPTYTARELQHQLQDSGAKAMVIMSGLYPRLAGIQSQTGVEHVILADVPDSLGFPFRQLVEKQVRAGGQMADVPPHAGVHRMPELLRSHPPRPPQISVEADDVVLFQYTGGTTGTPKAAMLTHRNLVSNVRQMAAWLTDLGYGTEKVLGAIPFFHVYGMTVALLLNIYAGSEIIVVPDPRNTAHNLEILHREKISQYPGIPTMYIGILNQPRVQEYDLRSIRVCLSGGAALPVEVQESFREVTGGRLVEGYGLTESSPLACANPIYGTHKSGSIGIPVSSTEAKIVSLTGDATGETAEVPMGTEGELLIRGPQVMKGYWNRPEETAETVDADGWLHTGDIAVMDEDGYIRIVDRKKDLIIASGYNIVPREVEEVLFSHPKVLEAVVAGVPDLRRGETVKAYVVLKEGQSATVEEIREYCKQNLAPYKVPYLVEFRSELPKSQVGKYLRRVLVEEELNRQS